jgi:hypothetical protein
MLVMTGSCPAKFTRGTLVDDDIGLNQWLNGHFGPKVNVIIISLYENDKLI